jgi:hypothetical protein
MSRYPHGPAALPRERSPGSHWIGGRVGPIAGLDDMGEEKIHDPTGTRTLSIANKMGRVS